MCREGAGGVKQVVPLLAPREPPTSPPQGVCGEGSLGRGGLSYLAADGSSLSSAHSSGTGPRDPPVPSGERVSGYRVSGGTLSPWWPRSGPPSSAAPWAWEQRVQCRLCLRLWPPTPTQCGAWRARKSKRVTRVAAMPRGQARPSATWPAEPSCCPHRPATKHREEQRARRTPAGPCPLHRGGQLGVWRQSSDQPPWTRRQPLGFRPRKVGREGPQHLT